MSPLLTFQFMTNEGGGTFSRQQHRPESRAHTGRAIHGSYGQTGDKTVRKDLTGIFYNHGLGACNPHGPVSRDGLMEDRVG